MAQVAKTDDSGIMLKQIKDVLADAVESLG